MLSYTQVTHRQRPTLQTHRVPRRMCRKAQVKKREKIKKLLTSEPHPALNQLRKERQREARRKSQ